MEVTSWDRVVFRGDPATREFIAFWLVGDRVVAGVNVNVWDVTDAIQGLIRDRVAVDDRRLADPAGAPEEVAQGYAQGLWRPTRAWTSISLPPACAPRAGTRCAWSRCSR
jgi:NAD/ferredoxin-dependent reductase-like protein